MAWQATCGGCQGEVPKDQELAIELNWGELFFLPIDVLYLFGVSGSPKKCWGWLFWVYRYIHWFQWLATGSMLFANIGTWFTHYFNKWLGNCPKKTDFLSDSLWHPEVPRSQAPSVKVVLKYRRVIDQPLDKVPKWAGWWVVWRLKISKNWIWLKVYVG